MIFPLSNLHIDLATLGALKLSRGVFIGGTSSQCSCRRQGTIELSFITDSTRFVLSFEFVFVVGDIVGKLYDSSVLSDCPLVQLKNCILSVR